MVAMFDYWQRCQVCLSVDDVYIVRYLSKLLSLLCSLMPNQSSKPKVIRFTNSVQSNFKKTRIFSHGFILPLYPLFLISLHLFTVGNFIQKPLKFVVFSFCLIHCRQMYLAYFIKLNFLFLFLPTSFSSFFSFSVSLSSVFSPSLAVLTDCWFYNKGNEWFFSSGISAVSRTIFAIIILLFSSVFPKKNTKKEIWTRKGKLLLSKDTFVVKHFIHCCHFWLVGVFVGAVLKWMDEEKNWINNRELLFINSSEAYNNELLFAFRTRILYP